MGKIKLPAKTPSIDMTPMVDLFFLLLTFFMLTTSFRPQEAVMVDTPSSISEKKTPEEKVITLLISKEGKIFFNVDGKDTRSKIIEDMSKRYNINLTKNQIDFFSKLASFGMPMKDIPVWLSAKDSKERDAMQTGMPMDSLDNQLAFWIHYTRLASPQAEVAIKADGATDFKVVKKVMDLLQEKKVNKFNLVTNLEKVEVKPIEK